MELHAHLLSFLLFALTTISIPCSFASTGQDGDVCISQGARFPRFSLDGQLPRKSPKGPDDLTLCRVYRKKTCCTATQTHPALMAIRKLASNGEGSEECLMFWEAMECAICDPRIGITRGPPVLCVSFCNSALKACEDAFFAFDQVSQVLMPCGPKDTICARAREWATNGSEFCQLAGFAGPILKSIGTTFCFDGTSNLDIAGSPSQDPEKRGSYDKVRSVQQRIRKLMRHMVDEGETVLWAIAGLVLTAGVVMMRRRHLSSQRRKQAMLRMVQEARSKQQAGRLISNKKIGKKL